MTPAERNELRWLRKVAKLSSKMVEHLDVAQVEEHARKWPGTTGPSMKSTAARTRDLMTALRVVGLLPSRAIQESRNADR
jgi:hypothetical protein